jgi:hypothetical protein
MQKRCPAGARLAGIARYRALGEATGFAGAELRIIAESRASQFVRGTNLLLGNCFSRIGTSAQGSATSLPIRSATGVALPFLVFTEKIANGNMLPA